MYFISEGVISADLHLSPSSFQFSKEKEEEDRGKWDEVSAIIEFVVQVMIYMGEVDYLMKALLLGRGGGIVYVYRHDRELYYLTPDQNGDNAPLIRM